MHSFVWVVSIIRVLSHHAHCNPLPVELPLDSDFVSDAASDAAIHFETPNSLPIDLTTQPLDLSTLDTSWLTDSSASLPDTTALFTDYYSSAPFDISLFPESSDALLESSCVGADSDFQPLSKRIDSNICTPDIEADPLLLKLPDLKDLENIYGPGIEKLPSMETFPVIPIPGYTGDDDMCGKPRRRLCCQGPLGTHALEGVLASCRGNN